MDIIFEDSPARSFKLEYLQSINETLSNLDRCLGTVQLEVLNGFMIKVCGGLNGLLFAIQTVIFSLSSLNSIKVWGSIQGFATAPDSHTGVSDDRLARYFRIPMFEICGGLKGHLPETNCCLQLGSLLWNVYV